LHFLSLSGRVLFVFSDPGGAKPLLALAEQCNLAEIKIISDRYYPFYHDFKNRVTIVTDGYEQLIQSYQPDIIFTGTSFPSLIEKEFMRLALQKGIPCFSFVDHWTRIEERFRLNEQVLLQPDQVWVIDERAKKIAIESKLKKENIIIAGNPYHQWLSKWKPEKSKLRFLQDIGRAEETRKLLMFAPDPLSNIKGVSKYGFDELTALADLVEIINNNTTIAQQWLILVKAHPNQDRRKMGAVIKNATDFFLLPADADTNTCIYYSDVVIGFFSSLLLEAAVLKKQILRFLPQQLKKDPLASLGAGIAMVNKEQLTFILTQ
jgi:CDP-Glycerol:Poly(glycerophosphate) glycerophosphotransferase